MPFLVNPVLTGIASAVKVDGAVIDSPIAKAKIKVAKSEFSYRKFNEGDIMRDHSDKTLRVGGTYAKVIDFGGADATSSTRRHSLDVFVDHDKDELYESPQAHKETKTRLLAQSFKLTREKRLASVLLATSTYIAAHRVALTGTQKWSDFTNSDPFTDIDTAIDAITLKTGFAPTHMVIGRSVATKLKNHPKYLARFQNWKDTVTKSGLVSQIAGLEVIDAHAVVNTANEGAANAISAVYDNVVIIMYVNTQSADLEAPSLFYIVQKEDERVREMMDERADGTYVEEDVNETVLPICDSAGFIYTTVI
jgi:hypothetical protein